MSNDGGDASAHGFRGPELIGNGLQPRLSTARSGWALLVWSTVSGTEQLVWARSFDPETGAWSELQQLFSGAGTEPVQPLQVSLATNSPGQGIAAWHEWDGASRGLVWADRFTPGEGWAPAEIAAPLDPPIPEYSEVAASLGDDGTALLLFGAASVQSFEMLRTTRQGPAGAWSTPETLAEDSWSFGNLNIAFGASGSALATWTGYGVHGVGAAGPSFGHFARFDPASGWGGQETIPDTPAVEALTVAGDDSYVAVWQTGQLNSNVYGAAGWEGVRVVDPTSSDTSVSPQLAGEPHGSTCVAYSYYAGAPYVRLRPPGGDWSAAEELAPMGSHASCSLDDEGNVTAVWSEAATTSDKLKARRRDTTGQWSEPIVLTPPASQYPMVDTTLTGVDGAGNVFVAWWGLGGEIWVNRYVR